MPKLVTNALSSTKVKQEKRPGRYADGNGLYLHVSSNADDEGNRARWWVWRGIIRGRDGRVERGIGSVRDLSLAEARERAREFRRLARQGVDPKTEAEKAARQSLTFEEAARVVHAEHIAPHARNEKHKAQWLNTLRDYAFPLIGSLPVHAVAQADILRVLAPIWTDKHETARRVRQRLRTVMDWARTAGHCEGINPVEGVEKGLPKQRDRVQHFRALPYQELPDVMRRIEAVDGVGALALRFAALTATRSGEVRGASWAEIDTEARVWLIPAERMKAEREHKVPLSDEALAVLDEVRGLSRELVFPSNREQRALSDMTLAAVLKRLNVAATVHGMRSTFRDWCEECTSFPHEVKEAALAHTVRNKVEAAYRRTDLFDKRRDLMDRWARFCCPVSADVIQIGGRT